MRRNMRPPPREEGRIINLFVRESRHAGRAVYRSGHSAADLRIILSRMELKLKTVQVNNSKFLILRSQHVHLRTPPNNINANRKYISQVVNNFLLREIHVNRFEQSNQNSLLSPIYTIEMYLT